MTKSEKQKMFNKAVKGLASQDFQQSLSDGTCAYRGLGGKRCAVGWLIPDGKYDAEMEGFPVDDIGCFKGTQVLTFLLELQEAHDDAEHEDVDRVSDVMKARLRSFAESHKLKLPKVLQ